MDTKLFVRKQAGGMFTVVDKEFCPGNIFYVDSTNSAASDSAGYGQNPDAPFATLDYAVGKCTASNGDVIFLLPGHSESVASATGCVLDVAGVTVIGLGAGSLQPKISLITAATATISITAANCKISNLHLYSNFTNGVTAGITIGADADGVILDGLKFTEAANTKEFLKGISIAAGCNDVVIENCMYIGTAGGTTSSAIVAAGATNNTVIRNNYINVDASSSAIKLDGAASTNLQVIGNRVINVDTAAGKGIDCHASSTGFVADNRIANLKDTVAGVSGAGMAYAENYCSNAVNASGIIVPGADS